MVLEGARGEREGCADGRGATIFTSMADAQLPPSIERVLQRFRTMEREEKMQSLLGYAKRLEPLPERLAALDRAAFNVPECQTRVDIFPESRDGRIHFYADINARQSPTVAAFLGIIFGAVNDHPPEVMLAIPSDFVSTVMASIGLHTREVGLNAMVERLKRHARALAEAQSESVPDAVPAAVPDAAAGAASSAAGQSA